MGKLASKLTKRIMAVALSTAMILSNMTVYASELSGPVQQTEETVENTETDVVELPSTEDETANDETSQDEVTQDETTSGEDSNEAPDDAEEGEESVPEETDEAIPDAEEAASEEEIEAEEPSEVVDEPAAVAAGEHTLWLVGDSTVCEFKYENYFYRRYGYGTEIHSYLDETYTVNNLALSGRSSKSFLSEANYQTLLSGMKAGDVLVIGFGHNDEKDDAARYTNPNDDYTVPGSFANSLYENYVKKAEEKGAEVILCTPIVRRGVGSKLSNSECHITSDKPNYPGGDYPEAIRKLGRTRNIPVVDLTESTRKLYEELGPDQTKYLHAWSGGISDTEGNEKTVDNTHLNNYGAKMVAYLFAEEISKAESGTPLGNLKVAEYFSVPDARPTQDILERNPTYKKPTYTSPVPDDSKFPAYTLGEGVDAITFHATIFGTTGGSSKFTTENYTFETIPETGDMHIASTSGSGNKITDGQEAFAMYYYQIPANQKFKFSAKAKLNSISDMSQSAFGLMARDDMYVYKDAKDGILTLTDYVAAGSYGSKGCNCFYRKDEELVSGQFTKGTTISANQTYELSIVDNGDGYECTFGNEDTQAGGYDFRLTKVDQDYVYIGMFVTRAADVTFSDIRLELEEIPGMYAIDISTEGNGTAKASRSSADEGDDITLTAVPEIGYKFKEWQVLSNNVTIENNQFTMPAGNVSIKAIFEKDVRMIDVWDFGALAESNTTKYSNNITPDILKSHITSATDSGTKGTYKGTSPAVFGDLSLYFTTSDRLYTTVPELSDYNYGEAEWVQTDQYKDIDGYEPAGAYYGGGTGNSSREYVIINNVQAGDKIIAYMGNQNNTASQCEFTFEGNGQTEKTIPVDSRKFNRFEFIAQRAGAYKIYQSSGDGKIMIHRIMRVPAVIVRGTIDFGDNERPSGYSVNFVNRTTKKASVATVSDDGTFVVSLAAGYTYTVALSGAAGLGFTIESSTLATTEDDAFTGKNDVTLVVERKSLYRFSGTIKGFEPGYDKLDTLGITLVPESASGLIDVELDIVNTAGTLTFSTELEPDVRYTLALNGVNDYELISPLVVYKSDEGTSYENRTITVDLKPMYDVVGGFMGLDNGVTVNSLKFTNVNDNYTYTAAVEGTEYSVKLRDGEYLAEAVVSDTDYTTGTHVVVNGGSISKDLMFVSSKPKASLAKKSDIYVGYPNQGESNYNTVKEAVEACSLMNPTSESERITVHIAPGTYREQIRINTPYISFVNGGDGEVLLTWYYGIGYTYYSAGADGFYDAEKAYDKYAKNPVGRWGAAVRIESKAIAFRAEGITFENSFNRYVTKEEVADGVEANPKAYSDTSITASRNVGDDVTSKALTERAAAIAVEGDKAEFLNCGFYSSQDTLYTNTGIHVYFKNCVIEGQTDFICGPGSSVFDACELSWKGYSDKATAGYLTANQSKEAGDKGYLFRNCIITANNHNSLKITGGYFGRPWSDKAPTKFINTKLQNKDLILAAGWTDMSARKAADAEFGEYNTISLKEGETVDVSQRTAGKTMDKNAADAINVTDYFGAGWTPAYYTSEEDNVSFATAPSIATNGDPNVPYPGNTLTAVYTLNGNNDKNDASLIKWYRVKDGEAKLITTSTAALSKKYKITSADVGSQIKVVVEPATVSGKTGTEQESALTNEIQDGYDDPDNASGDAVLGDGVNVFLVGDSTVKDYSASGMNSSGSARDEGSWGEFLQSYFNEKEVTVVNYANGGRSSRSFINEGSLDKVAQKIGDGDYLFIQFGHNDAYDKAGDSNKADKAERYVPLGEPDASGKYPATEGVKKPTPTELSGKGYGDECYTWDTSGGTFKWYLQQYIDVAIAAGATPVLVTPVSRMYYENGKIRPHHDAESLPQTSKTNSYVTAVKQLAEENAGKVLLIDGFELTKKLFEDAYADCGSDVNGTQIMHTDDKTHNNKLGGMIEAAAIASEIQKNNDKMNIAYAIKAPTNVRGATTTGKTVFNVDENSSLTAFDITKNYVEHATYWEGIGQDMINSIKTKAGDLALQGPKGALNAPKADPDPADGKVDVGTEVTLTVNGAVEDTYEIIYTTDGTNPKSTASEDQGKIKTYSDQKKIEITADATTIKTYAKAKDQSGGTGEKLADSKVVNYIYTLAPAVKAPTGPEEYPSGSVVTAGTKIELKSATAGAVIRYTMGTAPADPTIYSPLQKAGGITVDSDTTIKAIAVKDNDISDVATFTYKVSTGTSGETLRDPEFNPDGGAGKAKEVPLNSKVTLSSPDNARIYYTYGSDPADPDPEYADAYKEPIVVNMNMTIKAIAVKGNVRSNVVSRSYIVKAGGNPNDPTVPGDIPEEGFYIDLKNGDDYTYTGNAIKPEFDVYYNNRLIYEGTDYTVKYSNNVKVAGTSAAKAPTITIKGKGNISGSDTKKFNINAASINKSYLGSDDAVGELLISGAISKTDDTFNDVVSQWGITDDKLTNVDAIMSVVTNSKLSLVMYYNGVKLTTKDYKPLANTKWTADGTVTITGQGNFSGAEDDALNVYVHVVKKGDLKKISKVVLKSTSFDYNGNDTLDKYNGTDNSADQAVKEVYSGKEKVDEKYYSVSYYGTTTGNTTDAGKVKVTVTGTGLYTGAVTKTYTIKPAPKKPESVTVELVSDDETRTTVNKTNVTIPFISTGATLDQNEEGSALVVSYAGTALTQGKDYKITYSGNKKAAAAKFTITGLGNYKGLKKTGDFTVKAVSLAETNENIKVVVPTQAFAKSKVYKAKPYVFEKQSNGSWVQLKTSYYKVGYYDDAAGTKKITKANDGDTKYVRIDGKGGYASGNDSFQVIPYEVKKSTTDLTKAKITFYSGNTKATKFGYTGDEVMPDQIVIEVKASNKTITLVPKEDDSDGYKYVDKDSQQEVLNVNFASNVNKGKATVVISPLESDESGAYAGVKTATFSIIAEKVKWNLSN